MREQDNDIAAVIEDIQSVQNLYVTEEMKLQAQYDKQGVDKNSASTFPTFYYGNRVQWIGIADGFPRRGTVFKQFDVDPPTIYYKVREDATGTIDIVGSDRMSLVPDAVAGGAAPASSGVLSSAPQNTQDIQTTGSEATQILTGSEATQILTQVLTAPPPGTSSPPAARRSKRNVASVPANAAAANETQGYFA